MPCGRRLNGGALSLCAAWPSAYTNIAGIRTYCTSDEPAGGAVWRKIDFRNLGHALSTYVQEAALVLCPRYAELAVANANKARLVRWEVWDMPLKEIVPDAAVLAWIADKFPELDQDTASVRVGDAIHASQSSLGRKGVASQGKTLAETAEMVVYARLGEYSIHTRRLL